MEHVLIIEEGEEEHCAGSVRAARESSQPRFEGMPRQQREQLLKILGYYLVGLLLASEYAFG